MRIVISALVGTALTSFGALALAQPAEQAPPARAPSIAAASDAPPAPPQPGSSAELDLPPGQPSPFPQESLLDRRNEGPLLAGWSDGFYLRDQNNYFQLFPRALVQTDVYGFFGAGAAAVPATDGGVGLKSRLLIRRARLGLGGEFLKRWSFMIEGELGGQDPNNTNGAAQLSAAPAGKAPTAATARYAPLDSVGSRAGLADVWISYRYAPWLNLMVGQFNLPFSMENRTADDYTPWMERNLAIRSFVVPSSKDLGGMLWGDIERGLVSYEIGVFGGDGQNRPSVDNRVDFSGRVYARPFASLGTGSLAKHTQIGLSARHGDRDPASVGYDYPAITTGQGFELWKPAYTDSLGRFVHVLPSGSQNAIGGELRTRLSEFALQGEVYYVANNTREAVDGFQLTNTERLGQIHGLGWYLQLSGWLLGDSFVAPDPGMNRPRRLDTRVEGEGRPRRGLELIAIMSGINANYSGATRKGATADPLTPSADITVYELGLAAQYWHTKHVRFAVNYIVYDTPESGDRTKNQAVVPANLPPTSTTAATPGHLLHELGARLALSF
jgi:hypothetical protein